LLRSDDVYTSEIPETVLTKGRTYELLAGFVGAVIGMIADFERISAHYQG
jgi:hypothetical protein